MTHQISNADCLCYTLLLMFPSEGLSLSRLLQEMVSNSAVHLVRPVIEHPALRCWHCRTLAFGLGQ